MICVTMCDEVITVSLQRAALSLKVACQVSSQATAPEASATATVHKQRLVGEVGFSLRVAYQLNYDL